MAAGGANFAGLISVTLPAGIRAGELHTLAVHQLTRAAADIKQIQIEKVPWRIRLSIFRWIAQSIAPSERWYPVFQRFLGLLASKHKSHHRRRRRMNGSNTSA